MTTPATTTRFAGIPASNEPIEAGLVAAVRAQSTSLDRRDRRIAIRGAVYSTLTWSVLVVGGGLTFVGIPFMIAVTVWPHWSALLCLAIAAAVAGFFGVTAGRWAWRRVRHEWMLIPTWRHRARMERLATANALSYSATTQTVSVGTLLAHFAGNGWDVFTERDTAHPAIFGNARPRGDAAQKAAPSGWSFIAVTLPARVPHLIMTPTLGGLRIPPVTFADNQRISLEGDFDRWFSLFAPAGYGPDALYVMTPDLMAILIDHLPGSYVEAFDDTLVITTPRPLDFDDPATWASVSRVLDVVIPKAVRQTQRYRDSRSAVAGEVAAPGRRLRLGASIAGIVSLLWVVIQITRIIFEATH